MSSHPEKRPSTRTFDYDPAVNGPAQAGGRPDQPSAAAPTREKRDGATPIVSLSGIKPALG